MSPRVCGQNSASTPVVSLIVKALLWWMKDLRLISTASTTGGEVTVAVVGAAVGEAVGTAVGTAVVGAVYSGAVVEIAAEVPGEGISSKAITVSPGACTGEDAFPSCTAGSASKNDEKARGWTVTGL